MLPQINILLVDDHGLVLNGIHAILSTQSDMNVIGEVTSGEDAIIFVRQTLPDVILMDISMDGISGMEATRRILKLGLGCKVIMLTIHRNEVLLTKMANIGAHGYVTKGCPADELYEAIRAVMKGQTYVQSDLMPPPFGPKNPEIPLDSLSAREMEVLMMIVNGKTNQQMATSLSISTKTISTYRTRMFAKLPVNNDVDLTKYAINEELLIASLVVTNSTK